MALLYYQATPLSWCDMTPVELLMGRHLRTNLPVLTEELSPKLPDLESFRRQDKAFKQKQKGDYDRRHRSLPLQPIPNDTQVWVTTEKRNTPG
jgi:hypothetical protein